MTTVFVEQPLALPGFLRIPIHLEKSDWKEIPLFLQTEEVLCYHNLIPYFGHKYEYIFITFLIWNHLIVTSTYFTWCWWLEVCLTVQADLEILVLGTLEKQVQVRLEKRVAEHLSVLWSTRHKTRFRSSPGLPGRGGCWWGRTCCCWGWGSGRWRGPLGCPLQEPGKIRMKMQQNLIWDLLSKP